jgi:hypothetical protein
MSPAPLTSAYDKQVIVGTPISRGLLLHNKVLIGIFLMMKVGSSTCGFFGFNGTAGVWRRAAIEQAGKANRSPGTRGAAVLSKSSIDVEARAPCGGTISSPPSHVNI